MLAHDDARPRVVAQMADLHIVRARHDVEAAASPPVPHRRQEHLAVGAVGGEDAEERTLEQSVEIIRSEVLPHGGESSDAWFTAEAVSADDHVKRGRAPAATGTP